MLSAFLAGNINFQSLLREGEARAGGYVSIYLGVEWMDWGAGRKSRAMDVRGAFARSIPHRRNGSVCIFVSIRMKRSLSGSANTVRR